MAKLFPKLVAVKKISSSVPRSSFSEDRLERAAQLILKAGGSITPPVVRKIDLNSFEVVSGHFEYYAAVKAREIDPRKGEMIGVFSIDPASEDAVSEEVLTEQIEVFKDKEASASDRPVTEGDRIPSVSPTLAQMFKNLETQIQAQSQQMREDYKRTMETSINNLQVRVGDLEDRIPKPHPLLEALNNSSKTDLMLKLESMSSVNKTVLANILSERDRQDFSEFKDFKDLVSRIKGLAEKTTIKMIDEWTSR